MNFNQKLEFIAEVKDHPELYDKDNPGFHDYHRKEEIWIVVGEKFNISEPKKKWATLRDKFVRLKRLRETASPSEYDHDPEQKWNLYEPLNFLTNFCRHRKRSSLKNDISEKSLSFGETSKKIKLENNTPRDKRSVTLKSPAGEFEFAYTNDGDNSTFDDYQEVENNSLVESIPFSDEEDSTTKRIKKETSSEYETATTKLSDDTENMLFIKMIGKKLELLSKKDKNKIQIQILQLVNRELDKCDL